MSDLLSVFAFTIIALIACFVGIIVGFLTLIAFEELGGFFKEFKNQRKPNEKR